MAPLIRFTTAVFFLSLASCSSPSTGNGDLSDEQANTDRATATEEDAQTPLPETAVDQVTADTPINSGNYAEVMTARSREYARLEYKPVTLNSFECGDNCYLELTEGVEGAAPAKLLCTARSCADWQQAGALPIALKNKGAKVKFGTTDQVDSAGNVMNRDVRAVVDLRIPAVSGQAASKGTASSKGGTGPLPLTRGVYVAKGTGCKSPANAGLRIWNGTGLSGSATRNCRPTIKSRSGDTYKVSNSCENTYNGSRTTQAQTISVPDATHFTLDGQSFAMCSAGEAPADLEKLAR